MSILITGANKHLDSKHQHSLMILFLTTKMFEKLPNSDNFSPKNWEMFPSEQTASRVLKQPKINLERFLSLI